MTVRSVTPPPAAQRRVSARLRLALSYAVFLVVAGFITLFGVYLVFRYVPDYPLGPANPSNAGAHVASRGEILDAVVGVTGATLGLLALIGLSGGWYLAGKVLNPLQRINAAALLAADGQLDHRIRLTGRNDEFRQLADSFDHMLDRLNDAFATQERFAANASHELRTPLTVTRTLLDVARRNPAEQDYDSLLSKLDFTNRRAIALTEALLRLADANAVTAVSQPADLGDIASTAIAENAADAAERLITVTARLGTAPVRGDIALLKQLAANLVQNAIRHNVTSGTAVITTSHHPERRLVILRAESAGERFTSDQAARLHEPFLRGAGRVNERKQKGYGLGLALVARIVDIHKGSFLISPRPEGGLVVEVTLPADPSASLTC